MTLDATRYRRQQHFILAEQTGTPDMRTAFLLVQSVGNIIYFRIMTAEQQIVQLIYQATHTHNFD